MSPSGTVCGEPADILLAYRDDDEKLLLIYFIIKITKLWGMQPSTK
jgi:hypothetical protein